MTNIETPGLEQEPALLRSNLAHHLLSEGVMSGPELNWAEMAAARTAEPLREVLISRGVIPRRHLFESLARMWGLEFLDLEQTQPDLDLVRKFDRFDLVQEKWIPVRHDADGVLIASSAAPEDLRNRRIAHEVADRFGEAVPVRFVVSDDWSVQREIGRANPDLLLDEAVSGLFRKDASESAHTVLTKAQFGLLIASVLSVLVGLLVAPLATFVLINAVVNVVFGIVILFKFAVSLAGARQEIVEPVTDEEVAALTDDELPTYTILVPVYKEQNIVGLLVRNLGRLDYPPEKLQILLLLEEDDDETLAAARAASPPETVRFVIVPDGLPKTKPKACNVGLFYATGQYLVIYDAEDRPDPDQLKKAIVAFRKGDESMVVVQGALNYFNADENLLTRMFTLEYSYWFDYLLPGLDLLDLPIPLGGTSNHFRTDALRELGGWDPFNVTEDADLGVRASAQGYTVGVINSTTLEEANRATKNWIRQRSRWIKGYMQTALVHLRHPMKLVRTIGLRRSLGFFLLIGGTPITFLMVPILWSLFFVWLFARIFGWVAITGGLAAIYPPVILYISLFNLLLGNGLMVYLNMLAVFKRRMHPLIGFSVLNPAYWILHSIAAYMALWELFVRPFHWQKTEHGISRVAPDHGGSQPTGPRPVPTA